MNSCHLGVYFSSSADALSHAPDGRGHGNFIDRLMKRVFGEKLLSQHVGQSGAGEASGMPGPEHLSERDDFGIAVGVTTLGSGLF